MGSTEERKYRLKMTQISEESTWRIGRTDALNAYFYRLYFACTANWKTFDRIGERQIAKQNMEQSDNFFTL
jgi:hypothetical protein